MTTLDSDYCYADSHIYYFYAESRYVDCRYAECHGAARLSYNTVTYVTLVKSFISLAPKNFEFRFNDGNATKTRTELKILLTPLSLFEK
jgi:hypothetical protein